jgi:hypothetical protein
MADCDGRSCLFQAWEKWLRATTGKLRVDCLARRVCGAQDEYATLSAINEACAPNGSTLSHLYSIYVHSAPSWKGYSEGSIFRGREVSPRVKVEWGGWTVVEVSALQLRTFSLPALLFERKNKPTGGALVSPASTNCPFLLVHALQMTVHAEDGTTDDVCLRVTKLTMSTWPWQAERLLLRAALEDSLNQRFIFLSETCAPLIPAMAMYAQLMSEPKSRINACSSPVWDTDLERCAGPPFLTVAASLRACATCSAFVPAHTCLPLLPSDAPRVA